MKTKNDKYDGEFTDAEAQQARAYLRENASTIQEMMIENHDTDKDGRQLYLINDTNADGEEIVFTTSNDAMIVAYYRRLLAEPLVIGGDGGTILPDGEHRWSAGS